MPTTVEDFRFFSVHDLKRLGMLRDRYNGWMNWTENEKAVSSIGLSIHLSGAEPFMLLDYTLTYIGEKIADTVKLRFLQSNLPNHTGGQWMFICPITGNPCKILYLHNGHFKSRKALPRGTIYKSQTHMVSFRTVVRALDYFEALVALNQTLRKPYAKELYRGEPTRTAKRWVGKIMRYEQAMKGWILQQERQE